MITIKLSGGFGNNLKQYYIGCLIANIKKDKLKVHKHHHRISHPDSMSSLYKIMKGDVTNELPINMTLKKSLSSIVSGMDSPFYLSEIYSIRDFINQHYFNWDAITLPITVTDNDIIVSLRLGMKGEVVKNSPYYHEYPKGLRIPFTYYSNILDQYDTNRRIIICSDDFNNTKYLNQFNKYPNIVLANYDTLTQFQIMRMAKTIVLPNSSFGRGAILLSDTDIAHVLLCEKDGIKELSLEEYVNHKFL